MKLHQLTLSKIKTFLRSLWWHIYSGFPKSTQDQINCRLQICLTCEMYDDKNQQCLVCGCNISDKKRFLNKLAWADQKCPLGKWDSLT
jgi:hypothetical protein